MTVGRLLNEASSRELSGWMVFFEDEENSRKAGKQKQSDALLRAKIMEAGQAAAAKKKKYGKGTV